ncbi:uncharacterized protein LOC128228719 [Mya arenaria]|uniref:uncharacterized protein LOC128228719 n=1 Tax=Mya arenaria TaxID=6604 RepID=UPI0022E65422|nr:uncharacterized protein LOC128228719 [Mya arenaria]
MSFLSETIDLSSLTTESDKEFDEDYIGGIADENWTKTQLKVIDRHKSKGALAEAHLGPVSERSVDKFKRNIGKLKALKNYAPVFGNFMQKYAAVNIGSETIAKAWMRVTETEGKNGFYLSSSIVTWEKRLRAKLKKSQLIREEYKQREYAVLAQGLCLLDDHMSSITGQSRSFQLAERVDRIFQREWQQFFAAARQKLPSQISNREIVICLRDILKFCYKFCIDISKIQREAIQYIVLLVPAPGGAGTDSREVTPVRINQGMELTVKELLVSATSKIFPVVFQEMKQRINTEKDLDLLIHLWQNWKPPIVAYLKKCTEICWYLQTQQPAIALDFSGKTPRHFTNYTEESEDLDFVIWPAVLLSEDGLMISKGTAQYLSFPADARDTAKKHTWEDDHIYYYTTD